MTLTKRTCELGFVDVSSETRWISLRDGFLPSAVTSVDVLLMLPCTCVCVGIQPEESYSPASIHSRNQNDIPWYQSRPQPRRIMEWKYLCSARPGGLGALARSSIG